MVEGRWQRWALGSVLVVAAFLRLVLLIQTANASPFFEPNSDARFYDQWALAVAKGDVLLQDDWLRPRPGSPPMGGGEVFHLPPLYPYLLAGVYAPLDWFGELEARVWVIAILQLILGVANLVLVALLARRLFGDSAAVAAAALAAFYGGLAYWEAKLLITTLAVFLSLLTLRALGVLGDRPTLRRSFATGVLMGCLGLARPNLLPFVALALLWVLWRHRQTPGWIRVLSLLVIGIGLPLAASSTRNALVGGDRVLVSDNGGVNFYFGNHRGASGLNMAPDLSFANIFDQAARARAIAEASERRRLSASEVSSFFFARGREFVSEQPSEWLGVVWRKLRFLIGDFEAGIGWIPDAERDLVPILRWFPIGFAWILALGWIGVLWSRARVETWLLFGYASATLLVVLLFFFAARLRVPMAAVWCVLAGEGAVQLVHALRSGDRRRLIRMLAVAGSVLAASFLIVDREFRDRLLSSVRHTQGDALRELGRLEAAEGELEAAVGLDPSSSKAADGLARLLLARVEHWRCEPPDTLARRIAALERAEALVRDRVSTFPFAGLTLGDIHQAPELARYADALEAFEEALPGIRQIGASPALLLAKAARMKLRLNEPTEALELLEQSRAAEPGYDRDPDLQLLEARMLAALGQEAAAGEAMGEAGRGAIEQLAAGPPPAAAIVLERVRLEVAVWREDWVEARRALEALKSRHPCARAAARVMWLEERVLREEGRGEDAEAVQETRLRRYPRYSE